MAAIAVCCALSVAATGQPESGGAPAVESELDALLGKLSGRVEVGLAVADATTGQTWVARAAGLPLKPASVLKLFVTAAALERLGPEFAYETSVYLRGDEVWVIGAGDPGLGDERLARRDGRPLTFPFDTWADALRAAGVTRVAKLVLDDSIFDEQYRHPDWPADQSASWYQAPVGALNFNDNCLDVHVDVRGGQVKLQLRPPLPPSFIENALRVGKRQQPVLRRTGDRDVFEIAGTVARSTDIAPLAASRPTVFFGHALKAFLVERGIEVGEVVRRTIAPEDRGNARLVATQRTPLADVLWRCNTFSQNLFAECLVKTLAAYGADGQPSGRRGSWPTGTEQVRLTVAALGLDMSGAVLRDGSGLSHENRVAAQQICGLLVRMYGHRHKTEYLNSLAQPGREGSMRNRFNDPALVGRLRAKTGTISGVHALAGYATRPEGTTLAFAVLCNGDCDPELPVRVARILVGAR